MCRVTFRTFRPAVWLRYSHNTSALLVALKYMTTCMFTLGDQSRSAINSRKLFGQWVRLLPESAVGRTLKKAAFIPTSSYLKGF